MIPSEKNYKKVPRTLLRTIAVKVIHRLKAMSFGFARNISNNESF